MFAALCGAENIRLTGLSTLFECALGAGLVAFAPGRLEQGLELGFEVFDLVALNNRDAVLVGAFLVAFGDRVHTNQDAASGDTADFGEGVEFVEAVADGLVVLFGVVGFAFDNNEFVVVEDGGIEFVFDVVLLRLNF